MLSIQNICNKCNGTGLKLSGMFCASKHDPRVPEPIYTEDPCDRCKGLGKKINPLVKYAVAYQFAIHPKIRLVKHE